MTTALLVCAKIHFSVKQEKLSCYRENSVYTFVLKNGSFLTIAKKVSTILDLRP